MINRSMTSAFLGLLLLGAGCGDDQTVDPGQAPSSETSVEVAYNGTSTPVSLSKLPTTAFKDSQLVLLSQVWETANPGVDKSTLLFEFEASDGFKPSSKGCDDLIGTSLDKGYIDPSTRRLAWDESLGLGTCYNVKDVAFIRANQPTGSALNVEVSYNGGSSKVVLSGLSTTSFNGADMVPLSQVWDTANPGVDKSGLVFEFESSDGFIPSSKGCEDVIGTALDKGYIDPVSRDLAWDASLGLAKCYNVGDVAFIRAKTH